MSEVDLTQHFRDRLSRKKRRAGNSMRFEVIRLASFKNYPLTAVMVPSCLASRGFFYRQNLSNNPDDLVECYRCGCQLGDLQHGDDMEERHRQQSPHCPLLEAPDKDKDEVPFGPPQPARRGKEDRMDSSGSSGTGSLEEDGASPVSMHELAAGCDVPEAASEYRRPTQTDHASFVSRPEVQPSSTPFLSSLLTRPQACQPSTPSILPFSLSHNQHYQPTPSLVSQPLRPAMMAGPRSGQSFLYSMSESERRREMKREKMRLKTYVEWPENAAVSKQEVAKAGFYHIGPGDRVRCAFCFNVLRMWDRGDIPADEHLKYFPNCPMVTNRHAVGNIPLEDDNMPEWTPTNPVTQERSNGQFGAAMSSQSQRSSVQATGSSMDCQTLGIVTARPVHTHLGVDALRRETFSSWPITAALDAEPLVEAGFYYTGTGDVTRCFFCNVALRLWKADDDIWEEHARWQPNCGFVRLHKGEQFVENVRQKFAQAQAVASATTGTDMAADPLVDRRQLYDAMNSPVVSQVMEMGYSKNDVSKVLERQIRIKGSTFDLNTLLDAMSGITPTPPPMNSESSSCMKKDEGSAATSYTETEKAELAAAATATVLEEEDEDTDPATLMKENEKLKAAQLCKMCKKKEVAIVFLPCGHLVSCGECAPKVNYCPTKDCYRYIQGTIKAFRS